MHFLKHRLFVKMRMRPQFRNTLNLVAYEKYNRGRIQRNNRYYKRREAAAQHTQYQIFQIYSEIRSQKFHFHSQLDLDQ
jgi:hypothetical protein